jgi:thiaminase
MSPEQPDAVQTLLAELQRALAPVEDQLRRHPYVQTVEAGQLPRPALRRFAGEQFHIITSDLRSVGLLVSRFGDAAPSRTFFLGVLQGEQAALAALEAFARALGLTPAELEAWEPLPGAHAYTAYMAWLALYGSAAAVAAAYLVNFPAWGALCGRLSRALQAHYGLTPADVAFFDLFATPPPDFATQALAVIRHDLARGADPRLVRRAVRLLQGYELLYWDTLWAARAEPADG